MIAGADSVPSPAPISPRPSTAPAVYLHVGEPKTGTTFLQQVMFANRAALLAQGLLVPGARPLAHWRAAQDLRAVAQFADDPVGSNRGAWDRLAREALRAPRAAVISHELFAASDQSQAERAVRSLEPADVHIVLTVRDFGSLLPAEWQETVKHRNTASWDDWLHDVIDVESVDPDRRKFWFWRVHDTLEVLRVWSTLVPADHVHVIPMPPRGADPDLLWHRFAGVVGIDATKIDTSAARSNASLGLAEVELLRRLNTTLTDDVPGYSYMTHVKDALAHGALADRPSGLGRLELPADRFEWARAHGAEVADGLRRSGYDIVGDLDALTPRPPDAVAHPSDARAEDMLDSAVTAIAVLVQRLTDAQQRGRRVGPQAEAQGRPAPAPDPGPAPSSRATLARATAALRAARDAWRRPARRE